MSTKHLFSSYLTITNKQGKKIKIDKFKFKHFYKCKLTCCVDHYLTLNDWGGGMLYESPKVSCKTRNYESIDKIRLIIQKHEEFIFNINTEQLKFKNTFFSVNDNKNELKSIQFKNLIKIKCCNYFKIGPKLKSFLLFMSYMINIFMLLRE